MKTFLAYIKLMRPHQWVKNSFVFTGLIFSGAWSDVELWTKVLLVAAAFSLLSSSIYIINDIADRDSDRLHPRKAKRPIAAGIVPVAQASMLAALLMSVSLLLVFWYVSEAALWVLAIYLLNNLAYSFRLKHVVILDVFMIAAGFMLRILSGTIGVGIAPSSWLLLTGMMVTLFLGFTKRRAEIGNVVGDETLQRRVLGDYTPVMLDLMIGVTAASTVMAYSLYTVSPHAISLHGSGDLIYTTPFILYGMFRYLYVLYTSRRAEDPSADLFRDPHILVTGLLWLTTVMAILW